MGADGLLERWSRVVIRRDRMGQDRERRETKESPHPGVQAGSSIERERERTRPKGMARGEDNQGQGQGHQTGPVHRTMREGCECEVRPARAPAPAHVHPIRPERAWTHTQTHTHTKPAGTDGHQRGESNAEKR